MSRYVIKTVYLEKTKQPVNWNGGVVCNMSFRMLHFHGEMFQRRRWLTSILFTNYGVKMSVNITTDIASTTIQRGQKCAHLDGLSPEDALSS